MNAWIRNNWQTMAGIGILVLVAGWSLGNGPAACTIPAKTTSTPILDLEKDGETIMFTRTATKSSVEHVNENDFSQIVLDADVPVLVDFYADWCGPCRLIGPVLNELASETTGAKIVKVDVDRNPELAARYRISSIPNLLVFKDGKVVRSHVGLADKAQLNALIEF